MSWNSNSESDLAGYKTYLGLASGVYGPPVDIGNQTSHTFTNLGLGTYYFTVTAYDTSGNESTFSGELSKTFSQNNPPVLSGFSVSAVTSTATTLDWNTDSPASSQVEYGTSTGYGNFSLMSTDLVTSHSRTLSGLSGSTSYHYRVISTDAENKTAVSGNFSFTTASPGDITPPALMGITANSVNSNQATIQWGTNEPATSRVEYGPSANYGSFSTSNNSHTTVHLRTLIGLSPSTTYHYRVLSTDATGNPAISGNFTFTTASPPDTTPPLFSNIAVTDIRNTEAVVNWNTSAAANSRVQYGTSQNYGSTSQLNPTQATSHRHPLFGLLPSTSYHYRAIGTGTNGNTAVSDDFTFITSAFTDPVGPVISSISATNISHHSAMILWGTDESASGQVLYGPTTAYGNSSNLNQGLTMHHEQSLAQLQANTTYHYQVVSADAEGNVSHSADLTFTTGGQQPDTTPPNDVIDFTATSRLKNVRLSWTNPSDLDFTGVRIVFRTDRFPSDIHDGTHLGDFAGLPDERHETSHADLGNATTYYYIAASYDNHGNFQNTVRASATTLNRGGCGMVIPTNGKPPGPEEAAEMIVLLAILLMLWIKKEIRHHRFGQSPRGFPLYDPI
ncbi:fibronectin type III domain-containing protein [bacterium AH-315-L15]|nr:fibronectin type III domain-containing protein [bacterium AH-315-L15]